MNKMLLAVGFLAGVNVVSGCDTEKRIFSDESDGIERKLEYNTESRVLRCYNMTPDDFKMCEADLCNACEVEFTNCRFNPIVCDNVWKLTFTGCQQIKCREDALYYVVPWYCDDPDVTINAEKL